LLENVEKLNLINNRRKRMEKKTVLLTQLENDVVKVFLSSKEFRIRKSAKDLADFLRGGHPDVTGHNVKDAIKRLVRMNFVQRINGVERPEGEKKGLPSVTYGLDKKFYDSVEIQIVDKRPRRKPAKRKSSVPPVDDIPLSSGEYDPNETLEQIEILLLEKETILDEMRRKHEKLIAEMNELKLRISESQQKIEEAEFDILENREVVKVTKDGLEALNKLLAQRKLALQEIK
jgi:hypothetical protein